MSGSERPLNDDQRVNLNKFRNSVQDLTLKDPSDEYLLTWLTGEHILVQKLFFTAKTESNSNIVNLYDQVVQDFNVARAEHMLRQSLQWRKDTGADDILNSYTPSEVLRNYFSLGQVGIDKFECPVFISAFGRIDMKGLILCLSNKERINFITWLFETFVLAVQKGNEKTGKRNSQIVFVLDFEHFSMRQMASKPAVEGILDMIKRFLNNYPDFFRRLFIINAPRIFFLLLAMVKPLLPATDFPKMKIFTADRKEWLPALLEEIDHHQLPSFYGGTLTDPDGDPKCRSKLNMGGEVPHTYYLSNNRPIAKDYMETVNIIAGAGGKKKFKFQVDLPDSVMRWEFMTEGGDIAFRVYSKDFKVHGDLVPLGRVDSHLAMEEGQVTCDQPGKYVFEFDNTFSYLKTKKVRYHIAVYSPSLEKV